MALAGLGQRVAATLLDIVLFFLTLIVGYVIWELGFTLRNGQTPGKQPSEFESFAPTGRPQTGGGLSFGSGSLSGYYSRSCYPS